MLNDIQSIKNKIKSIKKISKVGLFIIPLIAISLIIFIVMFAILEDSFIFGWDYARENFRLESLDGNWKHLNEFNTMVAFLSLFCTFYVTASIISLISLCESDDIKNAIQKNNPSEVNNVTMLKTISTFRIAARIGVALPEFAMWTVFSKVKKLELLLQ